MAKREFVLGYSTGGDEKWGRMGLVNPFSAQMALKNRAEFSQTVQTRLRFFRLVPVPPAEVEAQAAREQRGAKGKAMSKQKAMLCPTCKQDMNELPHEGLGGKDCPQCGQGLSWRKAKGKWGYNLALPGGGRRVKVVDRTADGKGKQKGK